MYCYSRNHLGSDDVEAFRVDDLDLEEVVDDGVEVEIFDDLGPVVDQFGPIAKIHAQSLA